MGKVDKFTQTRFVEEILKHFYAHTDEGGRLVALGLLPNSIIRLDESFPYYDIGVRYLEFNPDNFYSYNIYCDVYFLSTTIYNEFNSVYISNSESILNKLYLYNKIFVISDNYSYKFNVPFSGNIIYDIDLSDYELKIREGMLFEAKNLLNIIDSGLNFNLDLYTVCCYLKDDIVNSFSFSDFKEIINYFRLKGYNELIFVIVSKGHLNQLDSLLSSIVSEYNYLDLSLNLFFNVDSEHDNYLLESNYKTKYRKNFKELIFTFN